MASNFRISIYRNSNRQELNHTGDFDGTSACELFNILSEKSDGVDRVLLNTSRLRRICPLGIDTLKK